MGTPIDPSSLGIGRINVDRAVDTKPTAVVGGIRPDHRPVMHEGSNTGHEPRVCRDRRTSHIISARTLRCGRAGRES